MKSLYLDLETCLTLFNVSSAWSFLVNQSHPLHIWGESLTTCPSGRGSTGSSRVWVGNFLIGIGNASFVVDQILVDQKAGIAYLRYL